MGIIRLKYNDNKIGYMWLSQEYRKWIGIEEITEMIKRNSEWIYMWNVSSPMYSDVSPWSE